MTRPARPRAASAGGAAFAGGADRRADGVVHRHAVHRHLGAAFPGHRSADRRIQCRHDGRMSVVGFGMGAIIVVNTLASQSFGAGDLKRCGRHLWQGVWFAVIYSGAALAAAAGGGARCSAPSGIPRRSSRWSGLLPDLGSLAPSSSWRRWRFGQFLLGIDRPRWVLGSALTGVAVNVAAVWVLVLGKLGLPAMGVAGAALAQNVGVTFELLVLVLAACRGRVRERFGAPDWRLRGPEFPRSCASACPRACNSSSTSWPGRSSATCLSAASVRRRWRRTPSFWRFWPMSFMPAVGVATAVTALVGRTSEWAATTGLSKRANLGFAIRPAGCSSAAWSSSSAATNSCALHGRCGGPQSRHLP